MQLNTSDLHGANGKLANYNFAPFKTFVCLQTTPLREVIGKNIFGKTNFERP